MRHPPPSQRRRFGFTVMELLVVVIMISAVSAIIFPALGGMMRDTRRASAINTIGVAVAAARSYAIREIVFAAKLEGEIESKDGYSGAAVIFTPYGELRLVENSQLARDGLGNALELADLDPDPGRVSDLGRNGYADIPGVDYLKLPRGYGAVGIMRIESDTPDTPGMVLLTAPFAIRFDEFGHLVVGRKSSAEDRLVFYDGNYDEKYNVTGSRPSFYFVEVWDPESPRYGLGPGSPGFDPVAKKNRLPFEQIDTVVGILLYSKSEMVEAGVNLNVVSASAPNINEDGYAWLMANGEPIYFGRTTGTMIREDL